VADKKGESGAPERSDDGMSKKEGGTSEFAKRRWKKKKGTSTITLPTLKLHDCEGKTDEFELSENDSAQPGDENIYKFSLRFKRAGSVKKKKKRGWR